MVYPPQLFRQAHGPQGPHGPHGPHGRFRGTGVVSAPSVCESRSTPPPSDHPALVAFGSGDGMWKSEMEITRCWCEFSIIQSNFDLKKTKIQRSTGKTRLEIDWKSDFHLYPADKASTNAWRTTLSYKIIATLTTTWDMIIAGIDFSRDLISLSLESLKSAQSLPRRIPTHQTSKPRLVVLWMACSSLFICLIGLSSC